MAEILLNIPHSSMYIPIEYRNNILLTDEELHEEINIITDKYCDEIFTCKNTDRVVSGISRLVCDVERFEDESVEEMESVGMGVVYTKTYTCEKLRNKNNIEREHIINEYYKPYHRELTTKVSNGLDKSHKCLIVDCHSFNKIMLKDRNRSIPDICIGTDMYHTSKDLRDAVVKYLTKLRYNVEINYPFRGSIVPIKYYHRDKRVQSIMIEINRDLYMDKHYNKNDNFYKIRGVIEVLINEMVVELQNKV